MGIFFVLVAVVAVVVIALVTVGDVVAKLSKQPPLRVFDLDEAVTFAADRLADEVTAQLSYADVAFVVSAQMDFFEGKGVARPATVPDPKGGVEASGVPGPAQIVDDNDALAYVLGRVGEADGLPDAAHDFDDAHVALVLEANDQYLRAIGAVGDAVQDPIDPSAD